MSDVEEKCIKRKGSYGSPYCVSARVKGETQPQELDWCETRQPQGWELVDRAEPGMGDGLPS